MIQAPVPSSPSSALPIESTSATGRPEIAVRCRQLLIEKRNVLFRQAREAFDENYEAEPSEVDDLDLAAREWSQGFELRLRSRERILLHKIEAALSRLDAGEYGVCQECEEPIAERRLLARPEATHCIECKEEQERQERGYSE